MERGFQKSSGMIPYVRIVIFCLAYFKNTINVKIVCIFQIKVIFNHNVLSGWNCLVPTMTKP